MKSPLKDRHSFKSAKVLKEIFPEKSVIESYLLYSAEIELALASTDRLVIAHTNKYPVYEFWWMAKNRSYQVASMAESIIGRMPEDMLYNFQDNWHQQRDPVYRAALFYILNRCSSLACASSGEIDKSELTALSISRLKQLKANNFYVVLDKFEQVHTTINTEINSDFKLFSVGHYSQNLLDVGARGAVDVPHINHRQLLQKLEKTSGKWVMLYKRHQKLFEKLKHHNIIMVDKYGNRTDDSDNCEDMIVANF
jgi:hypothetical protein